VPLSPLLCLIHPLEFALEGALEDLGLPQGGVGVEVLELLGPISSTLFLFYFYFFVGPISSTLFLFYFYFFVLFRFYACM